MINKNNELFYRSFECNSNNNEYLKHLNNVLDISMIDNWKKRTILKLYKQKYEDTYLYFRFNALKKWIISNQIYENKFIQYLDDILNVLQLKNCLNTNEKNYLEKINSIIFAKNRNIKKLIVEFELNNNEEVWYAYDVLLTTKLINNSYDILCKYSNFFITNKRLIVATNNNIYLSINYNDINIVQMHKLFIEIKTNDITYSLLSNEKYEIYVSIERIAKLLKRYI